MKKNDTKPRDEPLKTVTFDMLPPADTSRWVISRKAVVLAAIRQSVISRAEALKRYRLSEEELSFWQLAEAAAGLYGLRVTRLKNYLPLFRTFKDASLPQAGKTPKRSDTIAKRSSRSRRP